MTYDAIVVGSGPAGANAAAALVEKGKHVLMLDVGDTETVYEPLVPRAGFREIRESDPSQHRYFLGDHFEGVPTGPVGVGAQLTPPRAYVTASASRLAPIVSEGFRAAESLALGGLGAAWGAGVFAFDESELSQWPITLDDLRPHYAAVARRVGISAADDDLTRFYGPATDAMPALEIDSNAERVLRRYDQRRDELNAEGFHAGRLRLAVCTQRFRGRGPHAYRDMDFWADTDRSVYRPRWTIEELKTHGRFRYVDRRLVRTFVEDEQSVRVTARVIDGGAEETFEGRRLLLAAGTLGSARIALRSLERYEHRVPLLCNPYTYVPVINWQMLGREARDRRHSLAQLTAIYQPDRSHRGRGSVQTQFYSYRSLLTFRLMRQMPVAHREALRMLRHLMPAFGILGVSHDDTPGPRKYCFLRRDVTGGDRLEIHYELTADEEAGIDRNERAVLSAFRRIGCWPIMRVHPGHGSSIHYAGTFPMRREPEAGSSQLACDQWGRLAGTRAVHLVDGSTFPYLPAKGLTYTIMANANRIATHLAEQA